jgi:hypothetical protein
MIKKMSKTAWVAGHLGKAASVTKRAGNQPGFSSRAKRRSGRIFSRGLSGHQDFLIGDMRRRGPLRKEGQLQVVDNPVYHSIVGEESDDLWALA